MSTAPETLSPTDLRILDLLGSGVTVPQTAAAIGVSESRIAQCLSDDTFAARLAERRFESLRKHNARDEEYDDIEDKLIKQLKTVLPMMMAPEKILRGIQVINAAKRRGASSPEGIHTKTQVIRLQIPIQIVNRFSTNSASQVVSLETPDGPQSMITVQSGAMKKLVQQHREREVIENEHLQSRNVEEAKYSKFGL